MNNFVKKLLEFGLNKYQIKADIKNLEFKHNHLLIDKISFKLTDNTYGEINKFNLTFNNLIKKSLLFAEFDANNLYVMSNKNEKIINTQVTGNCKLHIFNKNFITHLNFSSISSDILHNEKGDNLPAGNAICSYENTTKGKNIECNTNFGEKTYLTFNHKIIDRSIIINAKATNIPLTIYKIIEKFTADDPVISYIKEHMKGGYIQNGELSVKLNKDYLKEDILKEDALKANLYISDLEYKYNQNFPPLSNINTDIVMSGPDIKFLINQAYSGKTPLSNAIMTFKWQGIEKSQITFSAIAKGEVKDLLDFIPYNNYQELKKQGIDLKEVKGIANSVIELVIPIQQEAENTYNISSNLTNVSLSAFNNKIIVQNLNGKGIFKDNTLTIKGVGKINNAPSTLSYEHNLLKNDDELTLKIKTLVTAQKQNIGILKLISGKADLNFEYKKLKNNENLVTLSSDLNNLEFFIDKLSIYKPLNKKANLTLKTKLNTKSKQNITFSLIGENSLYINGSMNVKDDKYDIIIPTLKYANTDLSAHVLIDKDNINTKINGNILDLSHSNMMQFLEKDHDSTHNIILNTKVSTIKLRNNIILNNFALAIQCNKTQCYQGSLNANIGTKNLNMLLSTKGNFEQWVINTDDGGSLLRGIGLYNNLKNGNMQLILNTKRHEVKTGEALPILCGKFILQRFIVTDIPFLTRLVSFVSLPGFVSSITNNRDIYFEDIIGDFSYTGNVIVLRKSEAHGPFFDFTMKGNINTKQQEIMLEGNVIPSFFLISSIITHIPVIGKIFSKVAPYSLKMKY